MADRKERKRQFSCYISPEIYRLMEFLREREEITRVVFVRRAIRSFMDSDRTINPRLRIRQKSDPDYVARGALVVVYMDEEYRAQLKWAAEEQKCTMSDVFFQAVLDYCAILVSLDDSGLEWSG